MITDPVADPADLTLSAASAALRAGALGAVEYLNALLARIDLTEPAHHTFTWIDREQAYEEAKAADQARPRNAGTPVLHGVPVGIKDLIDVKGMPSAAGCVGLAERVPTCDASVVTQLRRQGAIVLGKNTTHELGLGFDDPGTRNAWDSTRV